MASSEAQDEETTDAAEKETTEVLLQNEWECQRDGVSVKLVVSEVGLEIVPDLNSPKSTKAKSKGLCLPWLDVLGVEEGGGKGRGAGAEGSLVLHYIHRQPNNHWQPARCCLTLPAAHLPRLVPLLKDRCHAGKPKRLLVIINPISGRSKAQAVYKQKVAPLFQLASVETDVIVTEGPKHAEEIPMKYDLSTVDGVVVVGGDGLYNQVINGLVRRCQQEGGVDLNTGGAALKPLPVSIGIIPCGTGNGVSESACGVISVVTAALHIIRGQTADFNMLSAHYHDGKFISLSGLMVGYGGWAQIIRETEQRRNLGIARYPVVMFGSLFKKKKLMRCRVEYLLPEDAQNIRSSEKGEGTGVSSEDFQWRKVDLENDLLTDVVSFGANLVDTGRNFVFFPGSDTVMALVDKPCSRMQNFKSLVSLFRRSNGFFQEPTKVAVRNIIAWRIKPLAQESGAATEQAAAEAGGAASGGTTSTARTSSAGEAPAEDYQILNIDGEFFQLEKPEVEVWLHPRYLSVFSSRDMTDGVTLG